tara:strand:- start:29202 stop:29510 length:309 start_codon:yes stop_codon:yes gene_type:complete
MTREADIIQSRAAIRYRAALAAWYVIKSELESAGLMPTLFGSLAKGDFRGHSDIDIIVKLGDSGLSRSAVERIVSIASGDTPVDLFFVEDLTQSDLDTLLGT